MCVYIHNIIQFLFITTSIYFNPYRNQETQMEMDSAYFKGTRWRYRKYALQWNPHGERKIGRLRKTLRRSVNKELGRVSKTWYKILRRKFGPKSGRLHNEELHTLYRSPNIVRMI